MDQYSRWVAFLKVLLPLAALGLLSTLFLLSRKVDPDATIPFADRELSDRLADQQLTRPVFTGTSTEGDDIYMSAARVLPPTEDEPARAEQIQARLEGKRGQMIRLQSDRGTLEDQIGRATLMDNIVIETSTGYVLHTARLTARLDQSEATAPGKVTGHGPLGEFQAGGMQITSKNEGDGLHIVFKNGVRLVYDPKQTER